MGWQIIHNNRQLKCLVFVVSPNSVRVSDFVENKPGKSGVNQFKASEFTASFNTKEYGPDTMIIQHQVFIALWLAQLLATREVPGSNPCKRDNLGNGWTGQATSAPKLSAVQVWIRIRYFGPEY